MFIFNCGTCGKEVKRINSLMRNKSGKYYCSRHCAAVQNNKLRFGEHHPNYIKGEKSYRRYIKETCEDCGELRYYLLVIHHLDKNRYNNKPENLRTLCQNCHACRHLELVGDKLRVSWKVLTDENALLHIIFNTQ